MSALPKQEAGTPDFVTVLQAKPGLAMTKIFNASGVQPYDKAKFFKPTKVAVSSLQELSALLVKLESKPRGCVIRGEFKGPAAAVGIDGAVDGPDLFARIKRLYDDPAHHWFMIDIDMFIPTGVNPTDDPAAAIDQYIEKVLPECFTGIGYHWQLSSSAGTPGKEHILKAHVWFMSEKAYTSSQLTAWAKSVSPLIDVAPLRTVQVHYTANPVFNDGLADPVKVRSGLVNGWISDLVPLEIDDVTLLRAVDYVGEEADHEFLDPSQKSGVIGAFHRAYNVETVLQEIIEGEFVFEPGSARRVTWLNGGGTPGGCFITEDRMHFGSTHNTDPFDNRVVNLFDLVRHYKFGHLDDGLDAFELLDMSGRPSYRAMVEWAESQPEVKLELEAGKVTEQETAVSLRDRLAEKIRAANSEVELRTEACLEVQRKHRSLDKADIKLLAGLVKDRFKDLNIGTIGLDDARQLLTPPRRELQHANGGLPVWAEPYVYVTNRAQIYRYDSNEWLSRDAFDFKHNPDAGLDPEGNQMSAYALLRDGRGVTRVEQAVYMPQMPATFTLDGSTCVNTYRPSSVPSGKAAALWTEADKKAVARGQRHLELICGERPAIMQGLMDWLAFNVQHPGIKITYTWLIVGGEGVGKSWIGQMMAVAMGGPNVRIVSGQEVLNPTFNGWAEGAAFIIIEEVRVHGHKQDSWDNLKAPLTNPVIVIVRKGKDGYNVPNTANYLLLSNHDDAVPVTMGSRRVGVIKTPFDGDDTAKQLHDMAVREGYADSSAYFDALFDALNKHPEAIREWLSGWAISETFNPTGRAPETDEREVMILNSRSIEEVEIRDAIQEGGYGVTSSVVSPKHLKTMLSFTSDRVITEESLANRLRKLGFASYGHQMKWKGEKVRVWTKGLRLGKDTEANNAMLRDILDGGIGGTQVEGSDQDDFLM